MSPITYIGVGFEDGTSYYLGWTSSTPGEGQLVAYITDERNTLGGLCSPHLPKHMICFTGIGGGGLKIYKFYLNSSGLQEQHWHLILHDLPMCVCGAGCIDNSTLIKPVGQFEARGRPWYKLGKERKR